MTRPIGIIKNQLKTLKAELNAAKEAQRQARLVEAAKTLERLGYKFDGKEWRNTKPVAKPASTLGPIVGAGDLAFYGVRIVYVRKVNGANATVSNVTRVTASGTLVTEATYCVNVASLCVHPREFFIGK